MSTLEQKALVMNNDNRSQEALSLRSFFDHQIQHLQELVIGLSSHIHDAGQLTAEDRLIVESFVDAENSRMRAVHDYSHKLRGHVRALYNHVLQVADEIPPPINLNQGAIKTDPLINAMFVSSNDIDNLINTNHDVAAYKRTHDKDQAPVMYALLTASKTEKHTLGFGMQGEIIVRDLPQQAVNFSSHQIHTPCASSAELSVALKKYLFGRVEALINQEMTSRTTGQSLTSSNHSYESLIRSLANPDVYLNTLIKHIENPAKLLSIDKTHFKLSKLGIKIDSDDRQCANEFDIHELSWSDNTRNVILQIAYVN